MEPWSLGNRWNMYPWFLCFFVFLVFLVLCGLHKQFQSATSNPQHSREPYVVLPVPMSSQGRFWKQGNPILVVSSPRFRVVTNRWNAKPTKSQNLNRLAGFIRKKSGEKPIDNKLPANRWNNRVLGVCAVSVSDLHLLVITSGSI